MPTITQHIARDLKHRITSNHDLPAPLTLNRIAEYYRVSLTPVRLAVNELLAERYLDKGANGRLTVRPAQNLTRDGAAGPVVALEERREWESRLVEEIVNRSLRGETEYLREEAAARRYGVGRTVLRQAFNRLAGQGLLVHVPRCGWRVRPFDEEDLRAYLAAREALELAALDQAADRLDSAALERMLSGNDPDTAALNNDLHAYIVERSNNPYIRDFFGRHGLYYTVLLDMAAPEAHVISEMARQHREILTALQERDWSRARQALADHIRGQFPIVKQMLRQIAGG